MRKPLRLRAFLGLSIWLAAIGAYGCAPEYASEEQLSRVGFPIVVAVDHVRAYRAEGIGGGPTLEVTYALPKALLRDAAAPVRAGHTGFAIFAPSNGKNDIWRAVRLSLVQVWSPPRRIGVAVDWTTRYDSESGILGDVQYGTYPTRERLVLLERYPCRDLRAKLYVRREGWTILSRFLAPTMPSRGSPCVSRDSAATWGIR